MSGQSGQPAPTKGCIEVNCLWCALLIIHKALGVAYVNTTVSNRTTTFWSGDKFWSGA